MNDHVTIIVKMKRGKTVLSKSRMTFREDTYEVDDLANKYMPIVFARTIRLALDNGLRMLNAKP